MTSSERDIMKIYETVYKAVFTKKATSAFIKRDRDEALRNVAVLMNSEKYDEFARKFSKSLAKKGLRGKKGIWRKYFEAAKRAHVYVLPKTFSEYENDIMNKAVEHNFEMIKSIPEKVMEVMNKKYAESLIDEVAKGKLPRGAFAKELASHGHKQAQLIARTEAAKLQSAIMTNRATSLGCVAYEWLSSRDKRTRPSHRDMNGVIVFYRPDIEKPKLDGMQGNAGEFPNCRCSMEPIVDIDDLDKSNYKVYDYRTFKIITMTKKELTEALIKGSL